MNITWEVDDGYSGPSRPQHLTIDDEDLAECETDEERENFIQSEIQRDFDDKISWRITRRD